MPLFHVYANHAAMLSCAGGEQEARGKKQEARSKKQEAGGIGYAYHSFSG